MFIWKEGAFSQYVSFENILTLCLNHQTKSRTFDLKHSFKIM